MDLHAILTKPIQIVKEVLDLESDLEPPSLISQFVAIKHQLAEVQERLNESDRIAREKDVVIAKLQKAIAAKAQPRPTAPAFVRHEETPVQTSVQKLERAVPVEAREAAVSRSYTPGQTKDPQTAPAEELRLPAAPSYQAAVQQARSGRPPAAARKVPSPAQTDAELKPSAQAAPPAKAEKVRPTRTRVAARKTCTATTTVATPKTSAQASQPAPAAKAKPARTRATAKKATAKTTAKATAKPRRTSPARKS